MCDTKNSTRQKQLMRLDIVEESVVKLKKIGTKSLVLHTIGDLLANPRLPKFLEILRKHNMPVGFLSTNGLMLDKYIDTLIQYKDVAGNLRVKTIEKGNTTYSTGSVGTPANIDSLNNQVANGIPIRMALLYLLQKHNK